MTTLQIWERKVFQNLVSFCWYLEYNVVFVPLWRTYRDQYILQLFQTHLILCGSMAVHIIVSIARHSIRTFPLVVWTLPTFNSWKSRGVVVPEGQISEKALIYKVALGTCRMFLTLSPVPYLIILCWQRLGWGGGDIRGCDALMPHAFSPARGTGQGDIHSPFTGLLFLTFYFTIGARPWLGGSCISSQNGWVLI